MAIDLVSKTAETCPILKLSKRENGTVRYELDGKELTHILAEPAPNLEIRGSQAFLTVTLNCVLEFADGYHDDG